MHHRDDQVIHNYNFRVKTRLDKYEKSSTPQ